MTFVVSFIFILLSCSFQLLLVVHTLRVFLYLSPFMYVCVDWPVKKQQQQLIIYKTYLAWYT